LTLSTYIASHWSYVDAYSRKTHIIYTIFESQQPVFYYMNMPYSGQPTSPQRLTNLYAANNGTNCVSMIGSDDGKHIYVLLNAKRNDTDEMFYVESYSDGVYFSDPIYPRASDIDDGVNRTQPRIAHTKNNRIVIAYNKNGNLTIATRAPYNTVWSNERTLPTEQSKRGPVVGISALGYMLNEVNECFMVSALCKKTEDTFTFMMFTSKNGGGDWDGFSYPLLGHPNAEVAPIAVSNTTDKIFFSALRKYTFSTERRTSVLYERKGMDIDILSSFPISTGTLHSLRVCNIQGTPTLIYSMDSSEPGYSSRRLLLQIPEANPETYRLLPPVQMSRGEERNINMHCNNGYLFATALDYYSSYQYYYIKLKQYSFP
jgi:hypothetical protein